MSSFRDLVQTSEPLSLRSRGSDALARFDADKQLSLLAILSEDGQIAGLLKRSTFLSALAQGFGREIYLKRPIELLLKPALVVVESNLSIDAVAWALSETDADGVAPGAVVLEDGRYLGVVEANTVYRALTRSLDEKALRLNVALAQAEAARDAKANFLAAMSHEIRTPLNGILGMTQALSVTQLNDTQQDLISVISGSGEVLLRLLDDVLDMSKIESGKLQLDIGPVNVANMMATATALFAERAREKGIAFKTDFSGLATGWFKADSARIKQVIYNIASNAVKFTEVGEVKVEAKTTEASDKVHHILELRVSDTGIGMNEDAIARLFTPFEQADTTTTRRFGGSGLGLSICKSLVEMMEGTIHVESTVGVGSSLTVSITLPAIEAPTQAEAFQPARTATAAVRDTSLSQTVIAENYPDTLHILAAEDNETNQKVLTTLLEPFGIDLTIADNGQIAFDYFKTRSFDLVLMDLQMPVMGGLDCARAIRNYELAQGKLPTPILALSANAMRQHVDEALAAGMNGHVAKPISLPVLLTAIETALDEVQSSPNELICTAA